MIRELRHLISIDDFRHFGRAAKAVGLSQPALTKSLQRVEQSLGAKLFERSRSGVVPTDVGKEVLRHARRLIDESSELKRAVDAMMDATAERVAIGIGPAMAETYVAEAIASVAMQRPQTQISVRIDHWQQLSEWLLVGEIDFYVADVVEAKTDGRFHYTKLPPEDFVWFCRSKHPLAKRRKVSRLDLMKFPLATPKLPPWATEWFAAALDERDATKLPNPFPAIECESYAMLKQLVLNSDCISAALAPTLAREVNAGTLLVLPVDAPVLSTHAGIISLKQKTPTNMIEELFAAIETHAKASQR